MNSIAAPESWARRAMEGRLFNEFETDLSDADLWEVYSSLLLDQLVPQLLPQSTIIKPGCFGRQEQHPRQPK